LETDLTAEPGTDLAQDSAEEAEMVTTPTERIPVKNIWLLLLYAFPFWQQERLLPDENMRWENPPDEICFLVAELLANEVRKRLRRQLNRDYVPTQAVLSRVRGRIDLVATESRQLMQQGRIACRYHDFVFDTPRNRFVRAGLEKSAALLTTSNSRYSLQGRTSKKFKTQATDLAKRCSQLSRTMHEMGVLAPAPAPNSPEIGNFGRHDATDRPMVELAKFAFALALPTEEAGKVPTPNIKKDDQWLRRLFEQAVYGFFAIDSETQGWKATHGETIRWPIKDSAPGLVPLWPAMETDITLVNHELDRRIVIDTKFKDIFSNNRFEQPKLRSTDLYQIYTYVMSQRDEHPNAEGVLLYPAIEGEVDEHIVMQGHRFRVLTVDLAAEPEEILEQLRRVVRRPNPA